MRIVNISGIQEKTSGTNDNNQHTNNNKKNWSFHNILNDVSISLGLNPVDVFDYYKK